VTVPEEGAEAERVRATLKNVRAAIDRSGWVDDGERDYFDDQCRRYEFTLRQIATLVKPGAHLLDVGSHLLHFAMGAAALGYVVRGADVAYFVDHPANRVRQKEFGIGDVRLCDLATSTLPYEDQTFDVLNFSEALEHLNFNPLPVVKEFLRVLKPGGIAIVTTPNAVRLGSRLRMLSGRNVFADLQELCWGQPFGIHYREYTLEEVGRLLTWGGFEVVVQRAAYLYPDTGWRQLAKNVVGTVAPSLGGNLFVVVRRAVSHGG
jgi:SAM-dependent methyltransferase